MVAEKANIKVVVRVRPYNSRELENHNQRSIIRVVDKTTILFDPDDDDEEFFFQGNKINCRDITKKINKKLTMEFHRVFDTDCDNLSIFQETTSHLVDSVLEGYNCSVFVYGATGAGKTFTMLGSGNCPGITYLTMQDLFMKIGEKTVTHKFDIGVSYLEVYNENVMNLLTKSGPLKLREDSNGVVVSGLILKPITNADELLDLLALGNSNRTQHPTDANAESSRSHAVFQVHLRMVDRKTGQKRTVKLSMIDLAGSERAASTKGNGLRFKEGANINKSLLALGNCINKLADGMKHIPYRDSNLTRILKDSLGGNCQTLMISNVSQSSLTYEDTYNTLKYASRAKKIRNTLRKNVLKSNMPKEYYIKKVNDQNDELEKLAAKCKALEAQVAAGAGKAFDDKEVKTFVGKLDILYAALLSAQEQYFNAQSNHQVTRLRIDLKDRAIERKKILILSKPTADFQSLESSRDRLVQQFDNQKEEIKLWKKKYDEKLRDITKASKDTKNSKLQWFLDKYIQGKESEVNRSKKDYQVIHMKRINKLFNTEIVNFSKSQNLALEMLQTSYYIFLSDDALDSDIKGKYAKLDQMINGTGSVKFDMSVDDTHDENEAPDMSNYDINVDDNVPGVGINSNGKRVYQNSSSGASSDSDISIDSVQFKKPRILIQAPKTPPVNLNETISFSDAHNSTFEVGQMKNSKNDVIRGILSDHSNNSGNRNQISKALLRTNLTQDLLKSVSSSRLQATKRFSPGKVVKSPKASTFSSRTIAATAKFLNRQKQRATSTSTSDGGGVPKVRINRTASLRVKK
ncbi:KIF18A family protein [Megaselia abdita]